MDTFIALAGDTLPLLALLGFIAAVAMLAGSTADTISPTFLAMTPGDRNERPAPDASGVREEDPPARWNWNALAS